jgi:DNA-binding CsgD family transcriptional regulator
MRQIFEIAKEKPENTLTPRQVQVSALVAQGMSNKAIAESCSISVDTVKRHVQDAMAKTGCENRTALALWFLARYPTERKVQAAYRKAVYVAYTAKFAAGDPFYSVRAS